MRRPAFTSKAGRVAPIFASGALAAAMIVALGAAAAPGAGRGARSGGVTDYKFGLNAVSVLSSSDGWAVGDGATVLHWNGTRWAPVIIPGLSAASSLYTVDALSSSDVWAAGTTQANKPYSLQKTLIVHWDGTAWARVPSPGPSGKGLFVQLSQLSLDSATDGWAVGSTYNEYTNVSTGLALRWNGTRWQQVATNPAFGFSGVASFSPSAATAVGAEQTGKFMYTPAAFHWDGTKWTLTATLPAPPGVPASRLGGPGDLSADSATDVWTTGAHFTSKGVGRDLAWRWNGTSWTAMTVPTGKAIPGSNGLVAVAAISPSNAWAVGDTSTAGDYGGDSAPVSVHWNGTTWTQVTASDPPGRNGGSAVLLGVSAAGSGNIWAVGSYAYNQPGGLGPAHTLILHWNGTRWVRT
jgi:hypothetical protein